MLTSKRSNERLLALVLTGVIALNYPFISLFSEAATLFGIPVLYLYLFFVWSVFIFLVALIVARKGGKETVRDRHGDKPQR